MRKRLIYTLLACCTFFVACNKSAIETKDVKEEYSLSFNENGAFKIVQFTDIHWTPNSENCGKTIESIKYVLDKEKPDLAMITGDVVTGKPALEGWFAIAKIFEETKTLWAVTLGNHDAETDIVDRNIIFPMIDTLPYFVGESGPEHLTGAGNYALPIKGSKGGKVKALLYSIDTNNIPENPKHGHYDWVHFDQIEWYRSVSRGHTSANANQVIPSLAFIHIPLQEYAKVLGQNTTVGNNREGIASSDINSGLFASFVEMGDVTGVFCGHDHNNDYIGMEKDIALAFGRRSGYDAYGSLEIGARVIQLYEDERKFDTWISSKEEGEHTYYYYPSGLSSIDEKELAILKASDVKPDKNGISYAYYEGQFRQVAELSKSKVLETGELKNFSLSPAKLGDWFGFEYNAWIKIPETGVYKFYTFSDDGSVLYIDGKVVVDNDGSHSARRRDGKVHLEKGYHALRVLYFERYMGEMIEVGYASRNIEETLLPDSILFVK